MSEIDPYLAAVFDEVVVDLLCDDPDDQVLRWLLPDEWVERRLRELLERAREEGLE